MMRQPRGDPFDQLFAADPARFRWGVSQVTARDAVVDLLDRSATTFAWSLQFVPGTQAQDNKAYFNIVPIEVTVTGPDGRPINKGIFYDRCGKCPRLLPVPAPPLDAR